jgi:O-antigen ligase
VLIVGGSGIYYSQNKLSGFVTDPVRKTDSALAIDYIKKHPWWGMGYGLEDEVLKYQEKVVNPDLVLIHSPKTYVHNQLLGTMIQFGIPGAIVLIMVVAGLFWYGFKNRSYLLTLYMSFYLLFMIIEEPFYTQEGITRFTIFLALFIHISECDKPKKEYELFKRLSKR